MPISVGSTALSEVRSESGVQLAGASNAISWAVACTPESVRPAAEILTGESNRRDSAASIVPCTVGTTGWNCQPANGVPSYSTVQRIRFARGGF